MSYTKEQIIHAEELRSEQIELRKEHELLEAEKAKTKGAKKASLTRKTNKVYARLLELNSALQDAPPSPKESDDAIVEIGDIVHLLQGTYESAKAQFMGHCADNPDYAIKYCLENMLIAKAKADFLRPISKVLQSEPTFNAYDMLKKVVGDTRDLIMNAYVLNVNDLSTSRENNLLNEYKHEAAIALLQKQMYRTNVFDQMDVIFAGVEVWQILNKLRML